MGLRLVRPRLLPARPAQEPQGTEERYPEGPAGGSFRDSKTLGWSVYRRDAYHPDKSLYYLGFRCVVNRDTPLPQAHMPPSDAEIEKRIARGKLPPLYPPGSNNLYPDENTRCASCPEPIEKRK